MQEKFLAYINEKELLQPGDRVLLALSGGLDSVVMAHLFKHSPYPFALAHVNFGLRGEASEEDARFAGRLAHTLQVPFYTKRLAAAEKAEAEGISIQMAARDLRYQWFEELCQQENFAAVATAHHLNDLAETLLLNLSRGTGLAGLKGFLPKRDRIIRPLLFARRQELETYARQQELSWREDSSNQSLKYRRNKIRHLVIPPLKELNPQLEHTLQDVSNRLGAAERLLAAMVEKLRRKVQQQEEGHVVLAYPPILKKQEPQYLLTELLQPFGFRWQDAGQLLAGLQKATGTLSGKEYRSATHRLVVDRQRLVITALCSATLLPPTLLTEEAQALRMGPWQFTTRRLPAAGYRFSADPGIAALDADSLQFPLLLRPVQAGDRFQPLGMQGKKKLSDFMIDQKIAVNLKDEVLVLVSAGEIVWVAGHRIDERFKIRKQTQEIFEIRLSRP